MSGHSKWSTIKHKKGAADAKRGKVFAKIIKEISVAAKLGGGDMDVNPRLRAAVLKARSANMPKDNIERAIKKGMGELDATDFFENMYEGYGPGGVAVMVETLTDNKNRTAADVRSIFNKAGGNLGENGCVAYLFKRRGIITFEADNTNEDNLLEKALELGADDVSSDENALEIITEPEQYEAVLDGLKSEGFTPISSDITRIPDTYITLNDDGTRKAIKLLETLDDNDDVQSVSTNLSIPENFDG
ncbi:MAG: YebC/PmpR family DNA-binding transcriptional regulator [Salinispira sp.]